MPASEKLKAHVDNTNLRSQEVSMAEIGPLQNRVFELYRGLYVILEFFGELLRKGFFRPIQAVLTSSFEKSDQLGLKQ